MIASVWGISTIDASWEDGEIMVFLVYYCMPPLLEADFLMWVWSSECGQNVMWHHVVCGLGFYVVCGLGF